MPDRPITVLVSIHEGVLSAATLERDIAKVAFVVVDHDLFDSPYADEMNPMATEHVLSALEEWPRDGDSALIRGKDALPDEVVRELCL